MMMMNFCEFLYLLGSYQLLKKVSVGPQRRNKPEIRKTLLTSVLSIRGHEMSVGICCSCIGNLMARSGTRMSHPVPFQSEVTRIISQSETSEPLTLPEMTQYYLPHKFTTSSICFQSQWCRGHLSTNIKRVI